MYKSFAFLSLCFVALTAAWGHSQARGAEGVGYANTAPTAIRIPLKGRAAAPAEKPDVKPVLVMESLNESEELVLAAAPTPRFEITSHDESLYLALRRWAAESKYQLVWDAGKDFPARKTIYNAQSFEQAVEQVMADTETSGYPLHACSYANRVVRVLHISQNCQRK